MILPGTPEQWGSVWDAVEQEMADSPEKGLTVIFSVHEVETVCAVKMMQVRRMQPGCCRAVGHRATAALQPSHSSQTASLAVGTCIASMLHHASLLQ